MSELELSSLLSCKIELNPLFKACISEVCSRNITVDGVITFFPPQYYFEHFVSIARALLQFAEPNSGLVFRDVKIADYSHSKEDLIFQLSQLSYED